MAVHLSIYADIAEVDGDNENTKDGDPNSHIHIHLPELNQSRRGRDLRGRRNRHRIPCVGSQYTANNMSRTARTEIPPSRRPKRRLNKLGRMPNKAPSRRHKRRDLASRVRDSSRDEAHDDIRQERARGASGRNDLA